MASNLSTELHALRTKQITFRSFYQRTRADWHRMAVALFRDWKLPPTVTVDDVEQELLLGAWIALGRWKAGGMPLGGYVCWCAHNKATRWIHMQRQCNKHTRKGPGQYAWCVSALMKEGNSSAQLLESYADERPLVEDAHDYGEMLRLLPEVAQTFAGRAALHALIAAGGDVDVAVRAWIANPLDKRLFSLTPKSARTIIKDEVWRARRVLLGCENGGVL
jgi:DNA-directed RNA polymerase specialized sigma24 family protein